MNCNNTVEDSSASDDRSFQQLPGLRRASARRTLSPEVQLGLMSHLPTQRVSSPQAVSFLILDQPEKV